MICAVIVQEITTAIGIDIRKISICSIPFDVYKLSKEEAIVCATFLDVESANMKGPDLEYTSSGNTDWSLFLASLNNGISIDRAGSAITSFKDLLIRS